MLRSRADELHIVFSQDLGEAGILGQKAVARMHGLGAGNFAGSEQRRNAEIAVLGGRRANADALVGKPHVHGVGVRGRVHRHRGDAELLAGAQDAQRNFPAVGDQDFVEHRGLSGERIAGRS